MEADKELLDNIVERRIKELLLSIARQYLEPSELANWLYEEYGLKIRPDWRHIERAILKSKEIRSQELAVFLLEKNIEIPENEWLNIVTRYERSVPRRLFDDKR